MIVSVTTLGSQTGDAADAAAKVVKYLEGHGPAKQGRDPGPSPDLPVVDGSSDILGYYTDALASPGIWMGRGLTGVRMEGLVDPDHLHRVLVGQNPHTGDQLVSGNGSAQRAHADTVAAALRGPDDDVLSLAEAADALGVSSSYLRAQAAATRKARACTLRQQAAGQDLTLLPKSYLDATQAEKHSHWQVTRAELRRFAAEREAPPVVVGYDLTFSVPKSVSILWATATPAQQVAIEAAVTESVRVGMSYLEEQRRPRAGLGPHRPRAPPRAPEPRPVWWPPPTSTTPPVPSTRSSTSTSWPPTWPRGPTAGFAPSTAGPSSCTPRRPATSPVPSSVTA